MSALPLVEALPQVPPSVLAPRRQTWAEFTKPVPAVGFQSLVGMQRMGHLRVEGDMVADGRN